jgi:hypothetical protein
MFSLYRSWRTLRLWEVEAATFSDIGHTDGGMVVSPMHRPLFTPRNIPGTHSVRGWVDPGAIVRLEGLDKLKKSTSSGTRTGNLPACSTVPQQTTLLHAPPLFSVIHENLQLNQHVFQNRYYKVKEADTLLNKKLDFLLLYGPTGVFHVICSGRLRSWRQESPYSTYRKKIFCGS